MRQVSCELSYIRIPGGPLNAFTFVLNKMKLSRTSARKNKLCNYGLLSINRQTSGAIVVSAGFKIKDKCKTRKYSILHSLISALVTKGYRICNKLYKLDELVKSY